MNVNSDLEARYSPRPTELPEKYNPGSLVTVSACSTSGSAPERTSSASSSALLEYHVARDPPPDDSLDAGPMIRNDILAHTSLVLPSETHEASSDAMCPESQPTPEPEATVTIFAEDVVPECCVCLDALADRNSILPCGHLCVCATCAQALVSTPNRNKCPYCRVPFEWRGNCYIRAPDVAPVYGGSLYRQLRANFLERQARWHCEEPIRCPCGEAMVKVEAREAYYVTSGSPVECDVCSRIVRGRSVVYHCPQELDSHHPFGFDLCTSCGLRNNSNGFNCIQLPLSTVKKWFMRFRGLS